MGQSTSRGRGRLSSIDLLPAACNGVIAWAAHELAGRDRTQTDIYAEFVERCEALMSEQQELEFEVPSFSSFHRYAFRLAALTRRMETAREMASTIAARVDSQGSDDLTVMAAEAIKMLVFELLDGAGEAGLAPKDAKALADALRSALQAQHVSTERRQRIEKEFAGKVEQAVTTVAKAKGLTAETAEAIKAQILGVQG